MDGTVVLFRPLLAELPCWLRPAVIAFPGDQPLDYSQLASLVRSELPADEDFVLVAESFSGPLALLLADVASAQLRDVVLCASFARCPLPWPVRCVARLAGAWWFRLAPMASCRRVLLGRHTADGLKQLLDEALTLVSPTVLAARVRAIATVDVTAELQRCRVPVLYLAASRDRLVGPRSIALIRKARPDVQVIQLDGPHLLLQAAPAAAAQALVAFAQQVQATPAVPPDEGHGKGRARA
jgi:pimeloyl-ACP methyl ester carboxylesterase